MVSAPAAGVGWQILRACMFWWHLLGRAKIHGSATGWTTGLSPATGGIPVVHTDIFPANRTSS